MSKRILGIFLTTLLSGVVAFSGGARANTVLDWNVIAAQTIGTGATATPPRAGPPTSGDFAKVHLAMHDAVQAFERRFATYTDQITGAAGSPDAAAAKAARDVLAALYPAQASALDIAFTDFLTANGLAANDASIAIGAAAAAQLLAARANDGYFPASATPFVGGTAIGQWRPTPSYLPGAPAAFSPMAAPWLAIAKPFALQGPAQFRAKPAPSVTSSLYTRQYREVKALGSLTSGERTAAQTDLAYFWSDNFGTQWNRALRAIAASEGLDLGESARLFALANVAIADSLITAWDSKLTFAFWRPITSIQEGDNDGNPKTIGDPTWQSLINNPNYPDYTSGANNVTGAATRILQRFFETDAMAFSVTSTVPVVVQKTRSFTRFSQAAAEVVDARILLGIHFRFADTEARRQGRRVADWTFTRFLRPLD